MSSHHPHDPHATLDTPGATHDPVCGHWVVPALAHGTTIHQGETIHFCSAACKRAFDKAPERFFPRYQRRGEAPQATHPSERSPLPATSPMGFLDKIRGNATAPTPDSATDPVCHMRVDPKTARGKSEHGGQTYYFCSAGCKAKFEAEPAKFIGPGSGGGAHQMS